MRQNSEAAEAGLPGLVVTASLGLLAPAGTPIAIIQQIAQATRTVLAEENYQHMLMETGFEPISIQHLKISTFACRRRCVVDAGCQSARVEDRLIRTNRHVP